MTENPGGVESFLINSYRVINGRGISFDFLCNSYNDIAYENELKETGSRCFHIIARSKDPILYYCQLNSLFKEHSSEWDAVWVNVSSLANIDYLKIASKFGIRRRIIHSHNSRNMDGVLREKLHCHNKKILDRYATDYWACSEAAARWFFKPEIISKTVYIRNAVDLNRLRYNEEDRQAIRSEHGWEGKTVIGNVGRLHFQKNQMFMLDIFKNYHDRNPESVLVLIGQGEDLDKIKTKAASCGIEDCVYLAGVQGDIPKWLSAFDVFLFPSLFEGLPVAAMEAQANGVPVLASEGVIPSEVKINGNFMFFPLSRSAEEWADQIDILTAEGRPAQKEITAGFIRTGFEINEASEELLRMLLS